MDYTTSLPEYIDSFTFICDECKNATRVLLPPATLKNVTHTRHQQEEHHQGSS
jgi:hypothetical protein